MHGKLDSYSVAKAVLLAVTGTVSLAALLIVAVPAQAGFLYVSNARGNDLSQYSIGPGGRLAPLSPATVAGPPGAVAVRPGGHSVYVTASAQGTISQYSVRSGGALTPKSPATVAAGSRPRDIAISPDGQSAYVPSAGDGTILQYSIGSGGTLAPKSPATVPAADGPKNLVVSPDGQSVYVSTTDFSVLQYSVNPDGTLLPKAPAAATTVFPNSRGIAITPDGQSVYVGTIGSFRGEQSIAQFSVGPGGVLVPKSPPRAPAGGIPWEIAVSPNGHNVYVTNYEEDPSLGQLTQYTVADDGTLVGKSPPIVPMVGTPAGVAVSPDGHSVYASNGSELFQFTIGIGGVLSSKSPAQVAAGTNPHDLAVSPLVNPNPETTITRGPRGVTRDSTPTFAFISSKPASTFRCKVDSSSYSACLSPKTIAHVSDGRHTFSVRAKAAGHRDPTPATRTFRVRG